MEFRLVSDLHLEFGPFSLPELPGDRDRLLLLAGDVAQSSNHNLYIPFLRTLARRFRRIIWVMGNHEHYGSSIVVTRSEIQNAFKEAKVAVTILENEAIVIDDVAILGATLWTDVDNGNPLAMLTIEGGLNDFLSIRNGTPCAPFSRAFTPEDSVRIHHESKGWLIDEAGQQKQAGRRVVVVTHHAPSYSSIHPRYKNSRLNPAFASSMDEEIEPIYGFMATPMTRLIMWQIMVPE